MGDERVPCKHCGKPGTKHGGENNPWRPYACPAEGEFPKYPHTIKDRARALAVWDGRLARFWQQRSTSYTPVR